MSRVVYFFNKFSTPTGGTFLRGSIGVIFSLASSDESGIDDITSFTDVLFRLFWYVCHDMS